MNPVTPLPPKALQMSASKSALTRPASSLGLSNPVKADHFSSKIKFGSSAATEKTDEPDRDFWGTVNESAFGKEDSPWYRKAAGILLYPFVLVAKIFQWFFGDRSDFLKKTTDSSDTDANKPKDKPADQTPSNPIVPVPHPVAPTKVETVKDKPATLTISEANSDAFKNRFDAILDRTPDGPVYDFLSPMQGSTPLNTPSVFNTPAKLDAIDKLVNEVKAQSDPKLHGLFNQLLEITQHIRDEKDYPNVTIPEADLKNLPPVIGIDLIDDTDQTIKTGTDAPNPEQDSQYDPSINFQTPIHGAGNDDARKTVLDFHRQLRATPTPAGGNPGHIPGTIAARTSFLKGEQTNPSYLSEINVVDQILGNPGDGRRILPAQPDAENKYLESYKKLLVALTHKTIHQDDQITVVISGDHTKPDIKVIGNVEQDKLDQILETNHIKEYKQIDIHGDFKM